jgi:Metallo-beta-lactamase superfamily
MDSCLLENGHGPATLDYFINIGVDPAKHVKYVIASHWHDDHVRGIGELFDKCTSAQFVCAHGLEEKQFQKLVGIYRHFMWPGGSGVDEFTKVMRVLKGRRKRNSIIGPEFASAATIIYEANSDINVLIKALSPSSQAVGAAMAKFADTLVPKENQKRSRIPSLGPNDLALAITLRVGAIRVLFGADLEEDGREGIGWRQVLARFAEIDNGHQGVKIPHHGSITGHFDGMWEKLLVPRPWAIVTPYSRTKPPLPAPSDINRMKVLSSRLLLTAKKQTSRYNHKDSAVRKQLAEMNVVISEEPASQGMVRIRKKNSDAQGEWTFELFGDAAQLSP